MIRHAEASYSAPVATDFDRPLTETGIQDAQTMGAMLLSKNNNIDLILSSAANRTLSTARIISEIIGYKGNIIDKQTMYNASKKEILDIISKLNNTINSICIIGHNPTFHTLVEYLTNQHITHFFPCTIAKINFDIHTWHQFTQNQSQSKTIGILEYLIMPKKDT
tara:strand:+ start:46 stop:540 length:495 start_codon:yes stop_codon:yes gene_type:complete